MKVLTTLFVAMVLLASCGDNKANEEKINSLTEQLTKNEQQIEELKILLQSQNESKTNMDATGIAIVDLEKLLKEYKGYKDASAKLEAKIKRWESDLKTKQEKLQKDYQALERDAEFLKEEQVQGMANEMKERYEAIMMQEKEYYKQAADEERKLTAEVLTKVNAHLKQYAIDNNYKMILFTPVENSVFYAEDQINITEAYISSLNAAYQKGF